MDSVSEIKPAVAEPAPQQNERSTVEFPYTDLDSASEVVRAVHNAGGTACDADQLAAQLGLEAKGGGFRLRVVGAKAFGMITYERGGRITLTDIGRALLDQSQERQARVNAFLSVELYQKVYEQFKGGPLPPQAGLERSLGGLGVGTGVRDRARQVLLRSAKQAGFFEHASDRLVKPAIRQEAGQPARDEPSQDIARDPSRGGGGGGGGGNQHPLIQGLLMTLPQPGDDWPADARVNWLTMASSIFKMIYAGEAGNISINNLPKEKQVPAL